MKTINPVPKSSVIRKPVGVPRSDNTTLEKTRQLMAKIEQNNLQVKKLRDNNMSIMAELRELLGIENINPEELNDI